MLETYFTTEQDDDLMNLIQGNGAETATMESDQPAFKF